MKPKCCKKNKFSANTLIKTADFLKIIAEENRLKILCILRNGERCVCEVWQCLYLPQNLCSHHLKILKDAGLIASRHEGLKIFYSLNTKTMEKNLKSLNKFLKL